MVSVFFQKSKVPEKIKTPHHGWKSAFFILFLALWALQSPAVAQDNYFSADIQAFVRKIVDYSVLGQYDKAQLICEKLEKKYPRNPAGYFFRAAVLQSRMMDFENYKELDLFFHLTKQAIDLSRKDIKRNPKNSWPYFFLGASLAYKAFYHFREKNYFQAFHDGWKSIQTLQLALERDPSNYDIYLGIGAFKYYRSKYSKYLNVLPFVKDERKLGIELIKKAIKQGKFAYPAATNALIWIYIEEGMLAEADTLTRNALNRYPGSRFFLWGKATIAYKQRKWQAAETAYRQILASYQAEAGEGSPYNELVCNALLANIYQKMNLREKANLHAEKALAIKVDKSLRKRARPFRKLAAKIVDASQFKGGDE